MDPFKPKMKRPDQRANIWLDDGCFTFKVADAHGVFVTRGLDHELPDVQRLIQASKEWIDWRAERELARDLERLLRAQVDEETQEIMRGVFV